MKLQRSIFLTFEVWISKIDFQSKDRPCYDLICWEWKLEFERVFTKINSSQVEVVISKTRFPKLQHKNINSLNSKFNFSKILELYSSLKFQRSTVIKFEVEISKWSTGLQPISRRTVNIKILKVNFFDIKAQTQNFEHQLPWLLIVINVGKFETKYKLTN